MAKKYVYTSHETINHTDITNFGYDWDLASNPDIAPKYPLKIYLPRTTQDVVAAINECKQLGQTLKIRSKGHSSNDLVLAEKGAVLSTEMLNRLVKLDTAAMAVTVQSGTMTAKLDAYLGRRGYGLPVIGDHNDITAGGFASVGGFSPASMTFGAFVDNVIALEYVNWNGEVIRCSKTDQPEQFYKVLMGTGQEGVITTLTLRIIRVNKQRAMLENHHSFYRNVDEFIAAVSSFIHDSGDAVMERIVWLDFPTKRGAIKFGQLSAYKPTRRTPLKVIRDRLEYKYLHTLGYWAGRLPTKIDQFVKLLGFAGIMFAPAYSTIKNVETLTDKTLDYSVGDPIRMIALIAPAGAVEQIFHEFYRICSDYRERYNCFKMIALYIKGFHSDYISQVLREPKCCELLGYLGVNRECMTDELLSQFVSDVDDLCIAYGGYRYMHTKTVKDQERRQLIDPNAAYRRTLDESKVESRKLKVES